MTRDEQLKFCKKCTNRKMDMKLGLLCSLTGEKADFEGECPNFHLDEQVVKQNSIQTNTEDTLSTGLTILSFCIPLAGAIIYFSNKDKLPNKAKTACHAALIGFGIGLVLNIITRVAGVS
jgi:amino acid transporter